MSDRVDVLALIADWQRSAAPMPMVDILRIAADEIARLREERRWVPVRERLPTPGETVLMLMDGLDPVSGWYENGHFHNAYDTPYVTHWMPLPPGPEVKQ